MNADVAAALREIVAAIRVLGEQIDRQTNIITCLDIRTRELSKDVRQPKRRKVKAAVGPASEGRE